MFDIGFWELLLVFVIALVILGPERLPQAAGRVGRWVGNARAIVRNLRAQIEDEIGKKERAPPAAGGSEKPAAESPRKPDETA